ncbi:MAG: hypothetical protein AAF654_07170 [Myxococcota bacterium]
MTNIVLLTVFLGGVPSIEEVQRAYDDVRLEDAATLLDTLMAETFVPEARMKLLRLAPKIYLSVGRSDDAVKAVRELFTLDPLAPTPEQASPKIQEIYKQERPPPPPAIVTVPAPAPEPAEEETSLARSPWFWSALVAGSALIVGSVVILSRPSDDPPTGDLGPLVFGP